MIKGYVIEFNVRCATTGRKFPDSIIPSDMFGDTFTDTMNDSKIGDTSIAQNIEGIYSETGPFTKIPITIPVIYDQMFVVTSIE